MRNVVEGKELNNSLKSIETTTASLAVSSEALKGLMKDDMPKIVKNVNGITTDLKKVSGNLSTIDFAATFASINYTIANLKTLSDKLNNGEGTLGLLLTDKTLYNNLSGAAGDADKLLIDLKENPKRYVHFSLFGKKK